jgi:hypothetical protein
MIGRRKSDVHSRIIKAKCFEDVESVESVVKGNACAD